jgi:Ethanolamine utilization protein EutJ (predicted chaperonin)
MKLRFIRILLPIVIILTMAGCAKIGELEENVQRLQMENAEMKKQVQDVVNKMSEIIKRLESEIYQYR